MRAGLGPRLQKVQSGAGAAVVERVGRVGRWAVGKGALKFRGDEAADAGAAGGVDEVELFVVGNGGDEEVDAAENVVQFFDVLVVY